VVYFPGNNTCPDAQTSVKYKISFATVSYMYGGEGGERREGSCVLTYHKLLDTSHTSITNYSRPYNPQHLPYSSLLRRIACSGHV